MTAELPFAMFNDVTLYHLTKVPDGMASEFSVMTVVSNVSEDDLGASVPFTGDVTFTKSSDFTVIVLVFVSESSFPVFVTLKEIVYWPGVIVSYGLYMAEQ